MKNKQEKTEEEKKEHKKFMAMIRKNRLPIIYKNDRYLYIVYKNRVERYKFENSESKKEIDENNGENCCYDYEKIYGKGWNAYHEIDMLKNNGFKRVRDTERDGGDL